MTGRAELAAMFVHIGRKIARKVTSGVSVERGQGIPGAAQPAGRAQVAVQRGGGVDQVGEGGEPCLRGGRDVGSRAAQLGQRRGLPGQAAVQVVQFVLGPLEFLGVEVAFGTGVLGLP
jgi:hypothetical protein